MNSYFQNNNSKRHKLINYVTEKNHDTGGIDTIDSLREHLQIAIKLEHSTIPPYLCALYSIKENTNSEVSAIIRSVVMEEMLHMIMAANILNAVGGTPHINTRNFIVNYPDYLPHSSKKFKVGLYPFCTKSVETFLKIEKPSEAFAEPQAHSFSTIGQFYKSIRAALRTLEENQKDGASIFCGDYTKQIQPEHYYGSGGKLIAVHTLQDALDAIDEIIGQGEGIDGSLNDADDIRFGNDIEYAHYFRFNEIQKEKYYKENDKPWSPPTGKQLKVDWKSVYNMEPNPKMEHYINQPELFAKAEAFNKTYTNLLNNIHEACNGKPDMLIKGVALMYDLKYRAVDLMKTPSGRGNYNAGPSFEYMGEEI